MQLKRKGKIKIRRWMSGTASSLDISRYLFTQSLSTLSRVLTHTHIYTHTHTQFYTGELEAIALTQASSGTTSYIIIRPGGLSDKKAPLGMQGVQISQGDRVGGIINRSDVGLVTVAALLNEQAKNTVFELVSYKDTDTDTIPHRYDHWNAFFSKLRQNDGSHEPDFYPVDELEGKGVGGGGGAEGEGGEPATAKTDL
jgi:hypothetical protein